MNLHEAYRILELPPGADWNAVKRKHRFLSTVWHPDRMADQYKDESQEKLKEINNARDVLKKHFDTDHKDNNCECQEPDAEAYKQKEQEAKERFHREQEERRKATQAKERQARARNEARKKRHEEAEAKQKEQAAEEAARHQAQSEDIAAAYEQGKKLDEHKKYSKYTIYSLVAFFTTVVFLVINQSMANMKAESLKNYTSPKFNEYFDVKYKHTQDKLAYLKKHIGKNISEDQADYLQPPFDQSYEKILHRYVNPPRPRPRPIPIPVVTEPQPTQQDKWDIGSLEGQYKTRARNIATKEKLEAMLKKLKTATYRTSDHQVYDYLKQIYDDTNRLYKAKVDAIDFADENIDRLEKKISKNLGSKYLPKKPGPQQPYVIATEAAYNNALNSYPELFR